MRLPAKFERLSAIAAVSLPLTSLMYFAGSGAGIYPLVLIFAAVTIVIYSIQSLLELHRKNYRRKKTREDFAGYLHRLAFYRGKGGSYLKALEKAESGIDDPALRRDARASRKLFLMEGARHAEPGRFGPGIISGGKTGVEEAINGYALDQNSKQADIEESAQRYATFNMFISTILPSFLIFGFIGNSIMSQSGFGIFMFSAFLLLAVPLIYAIGNALMWRRLLA